MVSEDAQRAFVVVARREITPEAHQRHEVVGLEDRLDALLDQRHPVQAQARIDVLRREWCQLARRILVVLHEDEVPVLQEALVLTTGQVVGLAVLHAAVEVQLAAWAAGAGRAGLPEVLRARAQDDPLAWDADRLPGGDRLLVGADPERLVALEDRDPDVVGVEAEPFERQLPGELDGALLEVLADREVAEHLEEGEVPGGVADILDVGRAKALLAAREQVRRGLLDTQEIALQRVHPGRREQH